MRTFRLDLFQKFLRSMFLPGEDVTLSDKAWAETIGLAGLLLLSIGIPLGKTTQLIGLFMMFVAFCISWEKTKFFIKKNIVVKFVILFLLYVWGRTFWEILFGFGDVDTVTLMDGARQHTYILFLPVVAWWMGASQKAVFSVFAIIAGGLVFHVLFISNLSLDTMLAGRSAIGGSDSLSGLLLNYAFLCTLVIMWLILFAKRIVGFGKDKAWFVSVFRGLLWISSLLLIMIMLLTLQARTSLISLVLVLVISAIIHLVRQVLFSQKERLNIVFSLLFTIALGTFALLLFMNKDYVNHRFASDIPVINEFLEGKDVLELKPSSFSIRLWLSIEGWGFFIDNPVFGHTSGNIQPMLKKAEQSKIRNVSHLHNTYIEMLASWGLIGFSLMALVFIYIIYYLFYFKKRNEIDFQLWLFLFVCILLLFVGSADKSFSVRQHGWVFMIIIMAPAYSFCAHRYMRLSTLKTNNLLCND